MRLFVEELADDLAALPVNATLRIDPYLLVALQQSMLASLRALDSPDHSGARRELRIRLEQLRQVYRDLADAKPIYEDRPPKALVKWIGEVVERPAGQAGCPLWRLAANLPALALRVRRERAGRG